MSQCYSKTKLISETNILIIILNSGKVLEFDVKVNFELNLNISNFAEGCLSPINFELINIITYLEESNISRYFVLYSKNFVDHN